jgi:nucleoside recognition membrane protein YjiH
MGRIPSKEDAMHMEFFILLPLVVIVVVFTFTAVVHWTDSQRKEREAYYKTETLRRITEASGEGASAAVELLREDERIKASKTRENLKIAGLINVAVGIALMIFLHALIGGGGAADREAGSVYLCGLIPGFIGAAMLIYVYVLAPPLK